MCYCTSLLGVLERVFCLIGEYALHLGTILLVVTVLTIYTEIPTTTSGGSFSSSSLDASAAAVVDVVSSTVSGVVKTATATAGGDGVQGEL